MTDGEKALRFAEQQAADGLAMGIRLARWEAFGEALDALSVAETTEQAFTAIRELRSAAKPRAIPGRERDSSDEEETSGPNDGAAKDQALHGPSVGVRMEATQGGGTEGQAEDRGSVAPLGGSGPLSAATPNASAGRINPNNIRVGAKVRTPRGDEGPIVVASAGNPFVGVDLPGSNEPVSFRVRDLVYVDDAADRPSQAEKPRDVPTLLWCASECDARADECRGGYNRHDDAKALREVAECFRETARGDEGSVISADSSGAAISAQGQRCAKVLREQGHCGHIAIEGEPPHEVGCILPIGHDDGAHEPCAAKPAHLAALVELTKCICAHDCQEECCPQHGRYATLQEAYDGGREHERAMTAPDVTRLVEERDALEDALRYCRAEAQQHGKSPAAWAPAIIDRVDAALKEGAYAPRTDADGSSHAGNDKKGKDA